MVANVRASLFGLALLALAACSPEPPATTVCGPSSCAGCCKANRYIAAPDEDACGQNGGACQTCRANEVASPRHVGRIAGSRHPACEPVDLARPEDVEAGAQASRLIERGGAEVDGFGLIIVLHVQGRAAFAAKSSMPEAAGPGPADCFFPCGENIIALAHAGEDHGRGAAG